MADLTQQQVVDYIKGISVLELSNLVKVLEGACADTNVAATKQPNINGAIRLMTRDSFWRALTNEPA